jgi:hypothetical protein
MWERTAAERDSLSKALAEKNAPPDLLAVAKGLKDLFPSHPGVPTPQIDVMALVTALKGMQPPPQDPLAVLKQAKDLFAPVSESQRGHDEIAKLDQILGFAQKLASIRTPGGSRGGWEVGLDFAKELGPTVVQPVLQLINNMMMLRAQNNGTTMPVNPSFFPPPPAAFDRYRDPQRMREYAQTMRGSAPQPPSGAEANPSAPPSPGAAPPPPPPAAAFDPYRDPQRMREYAQTIRSPAPPPPPGAAAPNAGGQAPPANELTQLFASYGMLVVNALNNGTTGADFGEWVASGFGTATHAMIASQGEDALTQTMLGIPELAIFGEARLRKFSFEFVHFEEILESDDESPDEPPAPAQAKA